MDFSTIKSLYIPQGEVVKISTPTGVLWQKKTPYTELEYLNLDGAVWFNTKYYGNLETKIEAKWQRANDTEYMYVYGCASTGSTASITAYSNGMWRFGSAGETQSTFSTTLFTSTHDKNRILRNNSNTPYDPTPSGDFKTPYPIAVAGGTSASGLVPKESRFKGKYYYFKIWDDGELVIDWIPVTYEGVNGFWDKVTNTFVPPITSESIPTTLSEEE